MNSILLVEDDNNIREAIHEILEESGYQVDLASNGQVALDQLLSYPKKYDLILLDVLMPVMDGRELLHHLNRLGIQVPVVIISAARRTQDLEHLHWLEKPFDIDEMQRVISTVLQGTATLAQA